MRRIFVVFALSVFIFCATAFAATGYKIVAWNDLGMHCTDGVDYSVFGVLPPYNTVNVQLIDPAGKLVRNPGGITVTYEAVADARGSINTSSIGKTNFWQYVGVLFGADLPPDAGLAGSVMPGAANTPRPTQFVASHAWFTAVGIPITPFDDAKVKNYYPLMRFTARDASGTVLATTDVVLPVSDEMDCNACHASGGSPAARPSVGWAYDSDVARDTKLNVLAIHDQHQMGNAKYAAALAAQGYDAAGLRATSLEGKPILCARCHPSNALPGLGISTIQQLTTAIHSRHSDTVDPTNGLTLEADMNRSACYRCHPGSETKCLRGVMGAAVGADANLKMQCQSCHGSMSAVGASSRMGWLQEPTCQNCHTGNATANAGQIRYDNVFSSPGVLRTAPNPTFATNANTPATGLSLYRFSTGHGGLQCESCHGSTHAELASTESNDNMQSIRMQGHAGLLAECTSCHATMPTSTNGGPHGLHPIGAYWVKEHGDAAEHATAACKTCHGSDFRGTVLSRALGDRSLATEKFGTKTFWRGFRISCYACHDGPDSENAVRNRPAIASDATGSTPAATALTLGLTASDPDSNTLELRVVSQPAHGRAGISGRTVTYIPDPAFSGNDSFTWAAWDGLTDSNLGRVTVAVDATASQARLQVNRSGTGSGLVTSTPSAINCGASCSSMFPIGTSITLVAQSDGDSQFGGWSGPCSGIGPCTFTIIGNTSVGAVFNYTPTSYTLTVTRRGDGRGVVKSTPEGIDCGEKCATAFARGSTVTLTPIPESTSTFTGWSGDCSGTGSCTVSMTRPLNVNATFAANGRRRTVRR